MLDFANVRVWGVLCVPEGVPDPGRRLVDERPFATASRALVPSAVLVPSVASTVMLAGSAVPLAKLVPGDESPAPDPDPGSKSPKILNKK